MSAPASRLAALPLVLALAGCGPGSLGETGSGESSTGTQTSSSTETSTSGATDPTGTEDDTFTGFVPDTSPAPEACDMIAQDCPEGEKCMPYALDEGDYWESAKCVPVLGDRQVGQSCTYDGPVEATDDCDDSGICWYVDESGTGECLAFCSGSYDDPMCPEASLCRICGGWCPTLCEPQCDPIVQDCSEGLGCYFAYGYAFTCVQVGGEGIPSGEPCGYVNDCAPGNFCVQSDLVPACEGSACCAAFCDLELGDGPCDAVPGTSCVPFFEEGTAPPEWEHVGICLVPEP